jgi:hypothetical protein
VLYFNAVPPAIEYSKSTQTISVDEGNSIDMKCAATGYPTPNMTWCRVDAGLLPNGQLRYQVAHPTSPPPPVVYFFTLK